MIARRRRWLAPLALIAALTAEPASAQWIADERFDENTATADTQAEPNLPAPIEYSPAEIAAWGVLGAAAGFIGGGLLGYEAETNWLDCGGEWCGLGGFVIGAYAGTAVTTPLVVHLANGSRGSLDKEYLGAAVVAGAGFVGLFAGRGGPFTVASLLLTPVAQVVSATVIELRTAEAAGDG